MQGLYQNKPPFPYVAGCEFAGTVSANSPIPDGCYFSPGDRVFGAGQGAYAEIIKTAWRGLIPIPEGMVSADSPVVRLAC